MAYQLQLNNRETGQQVRLVDVDEAICHFLGEPCDPVKWCHHWMDTVGFALACGLTKDKLAGYMNQSVLERIWDFIETNYTNESYYTRV